LKGREKISLLGVFVFFILIRAFILFFYDKSVVRLVDVMAVFVAYANLKIDMGDGSALFLSWIAGLVEDLFSGTILGVNGASKLTMSFFVRFLKRKIEIGNFPVQILIAMFLFLLDVVFKYVLVSVVFHISVAESLIWSVTLIKLSVNTILFVAISAVLR